MELAATKRGGWRRVGRRAGLPLHLSRHPTIPARQTDQPGRLSHPFLRLITEPESDEGGSPIGTDPPPSETPPASSVEASGGLKRITAGTARMATASGLRQVLGTGVIAFTAAVVARTLGPRDYGLYSGGTAAYSLATAITDLGFSLVLIREMSQRPQDQSHLMGRAIRAQLAWSFVLGLALVALGLVAGGVRGLVMLSLAPALAVSGLAVSRGIFAVRFRATPLLVMDLTITFLQCGTILCLALAHFPVVALAIAISAWACVSAVGSLILARRMVPIGRATRTQVVRFFRQAIPFGVASVLSSLYFTIDLTLLGWLTSPRQLGLYAVAVRLLTMIVTVPGFIMMAGLPGLTQMGKDRTQMSQFAGTLAFWISISALPVCVGLAVFAHTVVLVIFGSKYFAAVPLIRILMLAGTLAFVSNVTGIVQMAHGIIRPQIVFNTISLIVNVTGNVVLVPRYGVVASAWLTVVSEGIVVSYGLFVLRHRLRYRIILDRVWRPLLALGVAAGWGLALGGSSAVAITVSVAAFLLSLGLLGVYPSRSREVVA